MLTLVISLVNDFETAQALGPIIKIRDAWCPTHGRVRPEMIAYPFTITRECLAFYRPYCPMRGCEYDIVLDAEPTQVTSTQHLELWTDELGTRPTIVIRPIRPGEWLVGVTPHQPDRPSGLAASDQ